MAELLAKSAVWGLTPRQAAGLRLEPFDLGPVHGIQLRTRIEGVTPAAQQGAAAAALGLDWPAPGRISSASGDARAGEQAGGALRLVWSGRDEALLIGGGDVAGLEAVAAVTGQTGAHAAFALCGADAADLLARLVPLDLRPKVLPAGSAARTLAHHVPVLLLRPAFDRFELLAPRSMAGSLWHELNAALDRLAARRGS